MAKWVRIVLVLGLAGCGSKVTAAQIEAAARACATNGGISYIWGDGGHLDGYCVDNMSFNLRPID